MFDIICTFGGSDKFYSILDFQKLPDSDIEKLRYSLVCPDCRKQAFYRKKSVDGKKACFGSRYCICREATPSSQRQREVGNATEVKQIIAESDMIEISYDSDRTSSAGNEASGVSGVSDITQTGNKKVHSIKSEQKRVPKISLEKILHSLIRGTGLATSDTIIPIGDYKYKAKNLFVKFPDAEPMTKNAHRFYWGTLYNSNNDIEWLNPAECRDVGIPLGSLRDFILEKFNISDAESLEGAAIIFAGRCNWNKDKTKKIIKICDSERIFISLAD
ncbi:Uncharacterised protein [Serratia quinivorans]|uniref:hypothetical protein n=1 Tax=Serratia TaxID=613 RepID=UPI001F4C2099|nr:MULTISPECIES: hypothetical protein [Serratia]ULG14984.1 hypothetical protein 149p2_00007 [Serratia proteamaculans]CAI2160863.1 Uncharacterised protein [Serratia quinivorans]CAI2161119.1 Uncharacterised protein [Serratia quinivorans]